jgi:hypothetical protein
MKTRIVLAVVIYELAVISCLSILTTRACARAGATLSGLVHEEYESQISHREIGRSSGKT